VIVADLMIIVLLFVVINLVGDRLRDVLNPRLQK
jgi:ABC-type dipeptide/oligopeptide/nickel transport system permease subunit